jgi:hypothetical protein
LELILYIKLAGCEFGSTIWSCHVEVFYPLMFTTGREVGLYSSCKTPS